MAEIKGTLDRIGIRTVDSGAIALGLAVPIGKQQHDLDTQDFVGKIGEDLKAATGMSEAA